MEYDEIDGGIGKQTRNYGNYQTLVPEMKRELGKASKKRRGKIIIGGDKKRGPEAKMK